MKFQEYFSTSKPKKLMGVVFFVIGTLIALGTEKYMIARPFYIDRLVWMEVIVLFLSLHFFVSIKKLWQVMFCRRFIIGGILFVIFVTLGYNYSSMSIYNEYIQANTEREKYTPLLGEARPIRSDEWMVTLPSIMSQAIHNPDLSTVDDALGATNTKVGFYPAIPTRTLMILLNPQFLGFLFLPLPQAISFMAFLPIFLAFFGMFELLLLITKGNKFYSLTGALLIVLSPANEWWSMNLSGFFASGTIAVLCFYKAIISENWKKKSLYSILLGLSGLYYIGTMYPAWQVPFGYLYLCLIIWILVENKEKVRLKDALYLLFPIGIILGVLIPTIQANKDVLSIIANTVYPGHRSITGGRENDKWKTTDYIFSIFYSLKDNVNNSDQSAIVSLYPLPLLMGLCYSLQNWWRRKKDLLLPLLTFLGIALSIWNYMSIGIFAKLTLLDKSFPARTQTVVAVICVLLLIKIMNDFEKEQVLSRMKCLIITTGSVVLSAGSILWGAQRYHATYATPKIVVLALSAFAVIFFLFLVNDKMYNKVLSTGFIVLSLFVGLSVNPINKGIAIFTQKPFAQEIQKIREKEPEAVWMVANWSIQSEGYLLATGVKVVNSTQFYPNFKFWHILDPEKKREDIYNRYSHVWISLTKNETDSELVQQDLVHIDLNVEMLKKLKVDYIVSCDGNLEQYSTETVSFKKIYDVDNAMIYQVVEE